MKVLQVGDTDIASRRFSGHDLNILLKEKNVEIQQSVWWKNQEDGLANEISAKVLQRENFKRYITEINELYSTNSLFYPFSYGLLFDPHFVESDVVHLHLIHNNFFDISHLPILTRVKPIVWTLHDLWPIQGHCVHPLKCDRWMNGCGDCPDISLSFPIQNDASALNWEYKKLVFSSCEMDIIVASQWMYDRIEQSSFFPKSKLHLVNFGIDLSTFRPLENTSELRRRYRIPDQNVVITFRANKWIYKGFEYVKECLRKLTTEVPITLLVFDEKNLLNEFKDRFQIIEVNWVNDDQELVKIYNTADIFLMPSVAESFGMMAIESMACGKPVIVMDQTALPEVVRAPQSGCIVVEQGNTEQLTAELEKLISNRSSRTEIGKRSRALAEKYYSQDDYVNKILNVYENAIQRKKNDERAKYIIDQLKKNVLSGAPKSPVFPLENVINVFPEKITEESEYMGFNISSREYKLLKLVLKIERSRIIQFLLNEIVKPVYKAIKKAIHR